MNDQPYGFSGGGKVNYSFLVANRIVIGSLAKSDFGHLRTNRLILHLTRYEAMNIVKTLTIQLEAMGIDCGFNHLPEISNEEIRPRGEIILGLSGVFDDTQL